ncbi:MAG: DRTGG domain-containing protein [Halanaerobium sp.]|nr:DRTGG domain-containing protein [Halanaerobium sp.]
MSKYKRIFAKIKELPVGESISVRKLAQREDVSEGTAYRAIKEAEAQGYVSSIPRVGTVRIENIEKKEIKELTFAEVVRIIEGQIVGGKEGLHKTLRQFVIAAMTLEEAAQYIENGNLVIVGDREEIQEYALRNGAGVLITGGFYPSEKIVALADREKLPLLSTSYDTFTTASLINKAIYDRMIEKDILRVKDILVEDAYYLKEDDRVSDWKELVNRINHTRYPVLDCQGLVKGIVTAKNIANAADDVLIREVMTRNPITVTPETSVAAAAHLMVWVGTELLMVTEPDGERLQGIITRQDVIRAIHYMQKQPQMGNRIQDRILQAFTVEGEKDKAILRGRVLPEMLNDVGTVSRGVLASLIVSGAEFVMHKQKRVNTVTENLFLDFIKPVFLENRLELHYSSLELGRKRGKLDCEVLVGDEIVAKAFLTLKIISEY